MKKAAIEAWFKELENARMELGKVMYEASKAASGAASVAR